MKPKWVSIAFASSCNTAAYTLGRFAGVLERTAAADWVCKPVQNTHILMSCKSLPLVCTVKNTVKKWEAVDMFLESLLQTTLAYDLQLQLLLQWHTSVPS